MMGIVNLYLRNEVDVYWVGVEGQKVKVGPQIDLISTATSEESSVAPQLLKHHRELQVSLDIKTLSLLQP